MPTRTFTRCLRSLFRFRLRTLLVVMLLVSVACGYLGKHLYRKSIERPIVARIEAAGGQVAYDYQRKPDNSGYSSGASAPGFSYVRRWLGDDLFASVESVWLRGSHTNDDVELVCQLPALENIWLTGNQITDDCVSALQQVDRLKGITLYCTSITPVGIWQLRQLPQLKHVNLFEDSGSTSHVRVAAKLPSLETMQISSSEVEKPGIDSLSEAPRLVRLEIVDCQKLGDDELVGLGNFRALRSLKLHLTSATGEVLKSIATLPQLECLFIEALPLTDADAQHLGSLSKLEVLDISETNLGDAGLAAVAGLPKLRHLDLAETKVSDVSAPDLGKLSSLEFLSIGRTQITDAGLDRLKPLANLKHFKLDIGTGRGITLEGAQRFQQAHPDCEVECIEYFPDGTSAVIDLATGQIKVF